MKFEKYKGKKVVVVGLGSRSGVSATNLLLKYGSYVTVTDIKKKKELSKNIRMLNKSKKLKIVCGKHPVSLLKGTDFVVLSPGVPTDIHFVKTAKAENIPLISEVELAYQFYNKNWIGITGTDGKSTTTSLVGELIKKSDRRVYIAGNIGTALSREIDKLKQDTIVVSELSSFQLETIDKFKPKIAVILNIAPDHLDRYSDMNKYISAKLRIYKNQDETDYLIINKNIADKIENVKSKVIIFDRAVDIRDNKFIYNGEYICGTDEVKIRGIHNQENILAALAVAKILNIEPSVVRQTLLNFVGLEHRMEYFATIFGRQFINDSKATTINSVAMALNSLDKPCILIAGGRDKGFDFSLLDEILSKKVKFLILYGEAKEKIKSALKFENIKLVQDLKQAVYFAYGFSEQGDTIILSPGCASFDMFKDYEERGRVFKKLVMRLASKV